MLIYSKRIFFSFMLVTKELKKYLKPNNSWTIKQKQLASSENSFEN